MIEFVEMVVMIVSSGVVFVLLCKNVFVSVVSLVLFVIDMDLFRSLVVLVSLGCMFIILVLVLGSRMLFFIFMKVIELKKISGVCLFSRLISKVVVSGMV